MNQVKKKQEFPVATTFGLDNVPVSITLEGRASTSTFVPDEETYTFTSEAISMLGMWMKMEGGNCKDGLYITGPTGSGKTSLIQQVCARLNIPLQEATAHDRLEAPELIGGQALLDGETLFQDGPLTTAMRYGHWFLLNEADLLDSGTATGLNSIVEGGRLTIPENGGEVIKPHPDFRFIATGNTNGGGDSTGLYTGTSQMNMAFMDRFMVMEVGYMDRDSELDVLAKKVPGLPEDIRSEMVTVANSIRDLFLGESGSDGAIEVTMSTRTLVRWAQMTHFSANKAKKGVNPAAYAIDPALALRASPETRASLHELVQRMMK